METELENEILGSEFDEELEAELEKEEKQDDEKKVEQKAEKATQDDYNKDAKYTEQQIDQERKNTLRAREEVSTLTSAYEQSNTQINQLKAEIAEIREAKETETQKIETMDPDNADDTVIKNIQLMDQRLTAKEQEISAMSKKIDAYEKQQVDAQAKTDHEQAKASVFKTVESTLAKLDVPGAVKYRNEATKLADELVDSGQRKQPKTFDEAIDLMTDCYLQVKKGQKTKDSVSVDTGKGGAGASGKKAGGIKPGKIEDVRAQMLKDQSWLKKD